MAYLTFLYVKPVAGPISQRYGANPTRFLPVDDWLIQTFGNYQPYGHTGDDYECAAGTPVYAAADGYVDHSEWGQNMTSWAATKYMHVLGPSGVVSGICVFLDHRNGFGTTYSHLSQSLYNPGDYVTAGTLIGYSGNTGRSTGPHMHFEVIQLPAPNDGRTYGRVDPLNHFAAGTMFPLDPNGGDIGAPAQKELLIPGVEKLYVN